MRKLTALILLSALILTCSCATAPAEEIVPEYDISLSGEAGIDMNGSTFMLVGITHSDNLALLPTLGNNALGDSLLERYRKIEADYNCVVDVKTGDMTALWNNYMAGLKYADLMNNQLYAIYPYIKVGMLEDMTLIDGIDVRDEEKYGTSTLLEAMTYKDSIYGVMAMQMGEPIPFIGGYMWYMPSSIKAIQMTDPHELIEEGIWTWDEFEKICVAATDTSGEKETWSYGAFSASGRTEYFPLSAINSNGIRPVSVTENGFVANLTDKRVIEAVDWVAKLIHEGSVIISDDSFENDIAAFCEGRYIFATEFNWVGLSKMNGTIGKMATEQFNWTFFPTGPSGEQGDITSFISEHTNYYFVPVNAAMDYVGYITSTLFDTLYTDSGMTWREVLEVENFWDETSFDIFMDMYNYPVFDYYSVLSVKPSINSAFSDAIRGAKTANQAMAEVNDALQNALDTEYETFFVHD